MFNKAVRKMKEENLCELRKALENGEKVAVTKNFFVSLPTAEAHHQCHPTGREVAMAQRHSKVIEKIHELVLEGVIDPLEVQRHLKHYVRHSLCGEQPPDVLDRAYYPELQDIRNHINKAKRSIQLSVLDQENVALKVEQWKKESPTANYLFRPFNKSSSESNAEVPEQNQCGNKIC